jgi:hypothetical protein
VTETGKGKPTPKRRDAQRRRGGPVAPPPATRKEAAKRIRAEGAQKRAAVRTGTRAGDERHMMARDQGPVRRLVRDVVDSRRHVGVLLIPATALPLIAQYSTHSQQVQAIAVSTWLTTLLLTVFDCASTARAARRKVRERFPDDNGGHAFYAVVRTAQFRRFRLPPPQVRPGDPV